MKLRQFLRLLHHAPPELKALIGNGFNYPGGFCQQILLDLQWLWDSCNDVFEAKGLSAPTLENSLQGTDLPCLSLLVFKGENG